MDKDRFFEFDGNKRRVARVQAVLATLATNTTLTSIEVVKGPGAFEGGPQASDSFYNDSIDDFDRVFGSYDDRGWSV